MFAEVADINYQSRSEVIDGSVADVGLVEDVLNKLIAGKMTNAQAAHELMHVERDDLRERLTAMLARKGLSAREKQDAVAMIAQIEKGLDKEKKALEQSHLNYATGQLAVYEDSKDIIKKLGMAGLNLAGKFVESSLKGAGQSQGQGRGKN